MIDWRSRAVAVLLIGALPWGAGVRAFCESWCIVDTDTPGAMTEATAAHQQHEGAAQEHEVTHASDRAAHPAHGADHANASQPAVEHAVPGAAHVMNAHHCCTAEHGMRGDRPAVRGAGSAFPPSPPPVSIAPHLDASIDHRFADVHRQPAAGTPPSTRVPLVLRI